MNVTFEELRRIKHALPHGTIARLAQEFSTDEETIRNYFGGGHFKNGHTADFHMEGGYGGGVVHLEDTSILERAQQILDSEGARYKNLQ